MSAATLSSFVIETCLSFTCSFVIIGPSEVKSDRKYVHMSSSDAAAETSAFDYGSMGYSNSTTTTGLSWNESDCHGIVSCNREEIAMLAK